MCLGRSWIAPLDINILLHQGLDCGDQHGQNQQADQNPGDNADGEWLRILSQLRTTFSISLTRCGVPGARI